MQTLIPAIPVQIDDRNTNVVSALRATYQKHLQPFEADSKTRLDPGAYVPSKGKRPTSDRPAHSADAASEAADDAAEAAEILGSLMNMEHTAILGQPPRKRVKMDALDDTVRQNLLVYHLRDICCSANDLRRLSVGLSLAIGFAAAARRRGHSSAGQHLHPQL